MINGFDKAVNIVKEAIEYGFYCNDLNHNEVVKIIKPVYNFKAAE